MNFRKILLILTLVSFSFPRAQTELSGFFDAVGVGNFTNSTESRFLINQFELDFSYLHKTHFSVGSALAYNNETENMELAMAFIHYSFEHGPAKHPRRVEGYDHSAVLIGKFDVPFGLDYLSYASIDRPTLTQPLVIEKTIAGWNDVGIDFHRFAGNFKFDVWAVNGFNAGIGLGGNVRYRVLPFLEIGISHSADIDGFDDISDWLSGVDFQINTDVFEIKSEFLWMKGVYEGVTDTVLNNEVHHGGYFQVLTHLEKWVEIPLFLTLRIGGWQCTAEMDDYSDDAQRRYTATLGYQLHENLSIRTEVVVNSYDIAPSEVVGLVQIVVGF